MYRYKNDSPKNNVWVWSSDSYEIKLASSSLGK